MQFLSLIVSLAVLTSSTTRATFVKIVGVESVCLRQQTCTIQFVSPGGEQLKQFNVSSTYHDGHRVIQAIKSRLYSSVTLMIGNQCKEMADLEQKWMFAVCDGKVYGHSRNMSDVIYYSTKQGHHAWFTTADGEVSVNEAKKIHRRQADTSDQTSGALCNRRVLLVADQQLWSEVFATDTIRMVNAITEVWAMSQAHYQQVNCRVSALNLEILYIDPWAFPSNINTLLARATDHISSTYYNTYKYDTAILMSGHKFDARNQLAIQSSAAICVDSRNVGVILLRDNFGATYPNSYSAVHLTFAVGRLMGIGQDAGGCSGLMSTSDGIFSYENQKWSECSIRDLNQLLKDQVCFRERFLQQCPRLCNGRGVCESGICRCNIGFIQPECYREEEALTTPTSTRTPLATSSTPAPSTTEDPITSDETSTTTTTEDPLKVAPSHDGKSNGLSRNTIIGIAVGGVIGLIVIILIIIGVASRKRKPSTIVEVERPTQGTDTHGGTSMHPNAGVSGKKSPVSVKPSKAVPSKSFISEVKPAKSNLPLSSIPTYVPSTYYGTKPKPSSPKAPEETKVTSALDEDLPSYVPSKTF